MPDERDKQIRAQQLFAITVVNCLIEAGDPDPWLRAHTLAQDAAFAARAKRASGTEREEDGASREFPPPEG